MDSENIRTTEELLSFIKRSPTAFQAVDAISGILEDAGFTRLAECSEWELEKGRAYYVTRNSSSVIAFAVPESGLEYFSMAASHTDSPTFKLKPVYEAEAFGEYMRINVEGYGGTILSTWLDRPLSAAGRIAVREGGTLKLKNVTVDRDLFVIPNTAVHLNKTLNSGYVYNAATDMVPLFGGSGSSGRLREIVADAASVRADDIVSWDMFLYNRTPGVIWGGDREFFSSPRIDNLQCAYSTLIGFVGAVRAKTFTSVPLYAAFDNEETGSHTKQGAASTFLAEVTDRICEAFGKKARSVMPRSFMLSADNGHARHPNHPELSDQKNAPVLNGGVVIKQNASQKYATDAVSAAVFGEICRRAGVPVQFMANRSDIPGGSTLGSISDTKVSLGTVDIGLSQLAMHSSYETAGCRDTLYMIKASESFFASGISVSDDGDVTLS